MSSVGRNANRFNGIRSAIQSATSVSTTTQEQLKAVVNTTTDQQKVINKRVEELESVVQALKAEVQALKTDVATVKATASSSSASSR
jgi:chromosome segregation ATPase